MNALVPAKGYLAGISLVAGLLVLTPVGWAGDGPTSATNVTRVGHLDIEGGGMVDVRGGLAVIGHMSPPHATSILDMSDPARPPLLARIPTKPGTHSHKARLCGTTLITNHERYGGGQPGDKVGLGFFDVSDPRRPREVGFLSTGGQNGFGAGVHRFEADCGRKLVYAGGSADGFQGQIALIVDFSEPTQPREVGRWWLPGQRIGAGEEAGRGSGAFRVHHPSRWGDRLYVSLWTDGFAIVDISDLAKPRTVSRFAYQPLYQAPTHTALPLGRPIMDRRWLLVFDEDIAGGCRRPAPFMWVVDITHEQTPVPVANFQPPATGDDARCEPGKRMGAHQPHEFVGRDNLVYAAWFSRGLRVIDISNPYLPSEVGHYVPSPIKGNQFAMSNDVFVDGRGLIYLIDRNDGLEILRFTRRP